LSEYPRWTEAILPAVKSVIQDFKGIERTSPSEQRGTAREIAEELRTALTKQAEDPRMELFFERITKDRFAEDVFCEFWKKARPLRPREIADRLAAHLLGLP